MMMGEENQRHAVVTEALSWLGTKYHHAGRVKGAGVDCAMILAEVYQACDLIPKIEIEHYPNDWHLHRDTERYLSKVLAHAVEVKNPKAGDIILWKFGRCFSHGAIVIDYPMCIHANLNTGVELIDVEAAQWLNFIGESNNPRERKFFSYWGEE